jgi:biopolymer transport protein ExbB/TolQ
MADVTWNPVAVREEPGRLRGGWSSSPLLLGGAATAAFYLLIPYAPIWREQLSRYFSGHWIEYVTTGLSFLALAILGQKFRSQTIESQALRWRGWLGTAQHASAEPVELAAEIERNLQTAPPHWQSTGIARRIRETCQFVVGRRSSEGIEDHLRYLADLAAEQLHASYSLVRTVTWAVPILGFLGTVVGITDAISNLTPEQLEATLDNVTSGLGTAFDTTALSLGWSMVIVFVTLLTERREKAVLGQIEEFSTRELASLFARQDHLGAKFLAAESQAADLLLRKTESLINWQTSVWQESIDALRQRWATTLDQQQAQLEQALQSALTKSLEQHDQQLATARGELLADVRHLAAQLEQSVATSRDGQNQQIAALQQMACDWQASMQSVLAGSQALLGELQSQGQLLLRLAEQEAGLQRHQALLAENLQAIRQSGAFEETLHTLNAAVHLLTNRVPRKAA